MAGYKFGKACLWVSMRLLFYYDIYFKVLLILPD